MQHHLKQAWKEFKGSAPGQRFQDRYRRHHTNPSARAWWRTLLVWGAGLLLLAIGTFLLVFPGPGIPFLFVGGGVLSSESQPLARGLDWCEVKIRSLIAGAKHLWKRMPIAVRVATVLVVVMLAGGIAYASFRIFTGRALVQPESLPLGAKGENLPGTAWIAASSAWYTVSRTAAGRVLQSVFEAGIRGD